MADGFPVGEEDGAPDPGKSPGTSVPGNLSDFTEIARNGHTGVQVYKAQQILDTGVRRDVAVKVLHGVDAARARRELELTVSLGQHANIVTVYDIRSAPDEPVSIIMEYCAHGSLADRLPHLKTGTAEAPVGTTPVVEVLAAGIAVANALAYAHGRQVVHRDIKPANILVRGEAGDDSTSYVVADFGTARPLNAEVTRSVREGTWAYASPQQLQEAAPHTTDDIWSLGATLFTLLDGAPPFARIEPGSTDNDTSYALRVIHGSPRQIRRTDIPDELRQIIDRCLQNNPAERFADAKSVRDALTQVRNALQSATGNAVRVAGTHGGPSAPATPGRSDSATSAGPAPVEPALLAPSALAHVGNLASPTGSLPALPTPPAQPPARKSGRRRWIITGAVVAVVLAIVPASIVLWPKDGDPGSRQPNLSASLVTHAPTGGTPTAGPRTTPTPTAKPTANTPQAPKPKEFCRSGALPYLDGAIKIEPCIGVTRDTAVMTVYIDSVKPVSDVTVFMWLVAEEGFRVEETLRKCVVSFSAANQKKTCSYEVRPVKPATYVTATHAEPSSLKHSTPWESYPQRTGTQSAAELWPPVPAGRQEQCSDSTQIIRVDGAIRLTPCVTVDGNRLVMNVYITALAPVDTATVFVWLTAREGFRADQTLRKCSIRFSAANQKLKCRYGVTPSKPATYSVATWAEAGNRDRPTPWNNYPRWTGDQSPGVSWPAR